MGYRKEKVLVVVEPVDLVEFGFELSRDQRWLRSLRDRSVTGKPGVLGSPLLVPLSFGWKGGEWFGF